MPEVRLILLLNDGYRQEVPFLMLPVFILALCEIARRLGMLQQMCKELRRQRENAQQAHGTHKWADADTALHLRFPL